MFFDGERGYPLSTYATNGEWGRGAIHQNAYSVTPHVYLHIFTKSFYVFGSAFVLLRLVLFVEI